MYRNSPKAFSSHALSPKALGQSLLYPVDFTSRWFATTAISGYQRFISPHKGYQCAHRSLHGGKSCSAFVKSSISHHGVWRGLQLARHRFQACGEAHQILKLNHLCQNRHSIRNGLGQTLIDRVLPLKGGPGDSCDDCQLCCIKMDACPCNGQKM
ncbi:membrane protein insertion efficiency factor YidD [Prochlorothrix hollandica]|uniref:membrane protein insertion efficiency factor YidD n=1 Tax=Prochlorothrix hollandica TaxID=1223 RepID=UPI00034A9583|nr:membrane protein insertion efficiency factor YidD [Prochlorothrix hollandica]